MAAERNIRPIDHLEAFCCWQLERIQTTLWHRFEPGDKGFHALNAQNDHLSAHNRQFRAECHMEVRR